METLNVTVGHPVSRLQGDLWKGRLYHDHSQQQEKVADCLIQQFSFKKTDTVCDVGCGDGKISAKLATLASEVIGVDPSPSMIDFARNQYALRFEQGSASELDYERAFDVITSFSALQWEFRQREALLAFKKALKPGGAILLALPGKELVLQQVLTEMNSQSRWSAFFRDFIPTGHVWTANEYAALLLETGFTIRKIEVINRPYAFEEAAYAQFVGAMLPHLSRIPDALQEQYLSEIVSGVRNRAHVDAFGHLRFDVDVLEVIAYV